MNDNQPYNIVDFMIMSMILGTVLYCILDSVSQVFN
jgi:hypothetical protein